MNNTLVATFGKYNAGEDPAFDNQDAAAAAGSQSSKPVVLPITKSRTTQLRSRGIGLSMLSFYMGGMGGGFTEADIEEMKKDPDVALGLEYLFTPILNAKVKIIGAGPEIQQVQETFDKFWQNDLEGFKDMFCYGYCAAEVLYKKSEEGLFEYDGMIHQFPKDCEPYVADGKLAYIKVQNQVTLEGSVESRPAKGLWLAHDPTYSPWFGNSVLPRSWLYWRAKSGMPDSAVEVLLKAHYKAAFSGLQILFPAGEVVEDDDGIQYDPRAEAEWYAENLKAGSNVCLPSDLNEQGKPKWEIKQYAGQPIDTSKSLPLMDWLSKQIHRGMGVVDEVITHEGNTGGYARSSISLMMFLQLAKRRANRIAHQFDTNVMKPLVMKNGGTGDYKFEIFMPGLDDQQQGDPNDPNNPGAMGDGAGQGGPLEQLFNKTMGGASGVQAGEMPTAGGNSDGGDQGQGGSPSEQNMSIAGSLEGFTEAVRKRMKLLVPSTNGNGNGKHHHL